MYAPSPWAPGGPRPDGAELGRCNISSISADQGIQGEANLALSHRRWICSNARNPPDHFPQDSLLCGLSWYENWLQQSESVHKRQGRASASKPES